MESKPTRFDARLIQATSLARYKQLPLTQFVANDIQSAAMGNNAIVAAANPAPALASRDLIATDTVVTTATVAQSTYMR